MGRKGSDVQFAIDVGRSLMSLDYHTFFRLYVNAPNMAGYVMDFFVVSLYCGAGSSLIKVVAC